MSILKRMQILLWVFFDDPQSSLAAKCWTWMDIGFIFISVAAMFVVTTAYFTALTQIPYSYIFHIVA